MNWDFLNGVGVGAASAAVASLVGQLIKSVFEELIKWRTKLKTDDREWIASGVRDLDKMMESILRLTLDFYRAPSAAGIAKSREIKESLLIFESLWRGVADVIDVYSKHALKLNHRDKLIFCIRRMLDTERTEMLNIDHPHLLEIVVVVSDAREWLQAIYRKVR